MNSAHRDRPRSNVLYSLRLRLILMSFIIILLSMLLAAWSVLHILRQHIAEDVNSRLHSDVSAASFYYQGQVDRVRSSIHTVALDNTVKTTLRLEILGQLQKHLDQLAEQHQLDFLLIVDPQGNVKLPGLPHKITEGSLARHPLIAHREGSDVAAGTLLEEHVSLLYFLEQEGKDIDYRPVVLMEAAAPIVLRNKVLGTVLGGVMVTDNRELVSGIQEAAGGGRVAFVAADRMAAGSHIIDKENGRRQVYFPVSLDYESNRHPAVRNVIICPLDKTELVFDYRPLVMPGLDNELLLVILRPVAELIQVLNNISRALLLVFAVALLVALAGAVFMARSIARPLHEVADSMNRLRQGEKVEPLLCRRGDEIGDLVSGFNDMAHSLEIRLLELDEEIRNRLQAEEMLAKESERFRVTLQSMSDGVLAVDNAGRIVFMNRVAEELTGRHQDRAIGTPLAEVLNVAGPDGKEMSTEPLRWVEHAGEEGALLTRDLHFRRQGGGEGLITVTGSRLIDRQQGVLGAVLVVRDVTEQRRMEEELARGQKLESVGVLAGGIAHDFNNLLTAILGNLSLARMVSAEDDAHYRNIEDAEKASLRAQELTQQLLTFSRGGSPVKDTVDVYELVRESAEFVAHGSKIKLRFACDDGLWQVYVDRGQIGQVIDNLVINAIQSMPDGGSVDIDMLNYRLEAGSPLPLSGKRFVRVGVHDHGTGIAAEHHSKIFDPYFTTKEVGSGLGLAICFSIVKKHGGHVTVESKPGKGSSFYVYLPAVDSGRLELSAPVEEPASLASGSGQRVLVMDDEEMVRNVVESMLALLDYFVETARDGREAIEKYVQAMNRREHYDVVIMDLTVPGGMGGEEAVKRLLEIDPEARVVVASGYSRHEVMADYKRFGFSGMIVKPFRIHELDQTLKELLS